MHTEIHPPVLSPQQREHYHQEGYCIAESVIPEPVLAELRAACDRLVAQQQAELEAQGETTRGINVSGSRFFIGGRHEQEPAMRDFLFSDVMAELCRELIGPDAYLFCEQMVVKAAERGASFAWHQDSGYVGFDHTPYITLWCALDDATIENGTVFVLPYSRSGGRELIEHEWSEQDNAYVGYHGDDPGIPAVVPAGSIVAFSSLTFHRSGCNQTDHPRRAYICQYSPEAIYFPDSDRIKNFALPVLRDGERVPPATDPAR